MKNYLTKDNFYRLIILILVAALLIACAPALSVTAQTDSPFVFVGSFTGLNGESPYTYEIRSYTSSNGDTCEVATSTGYTPDIEIVCH